MSVHSIITQQMSWCMDGWWCFSHLTHAYICACWCNLDFDFVRKHLRILSYEIEIQVAPASTDASMGEVREILSLFFASSWLVDALLVGLMIPISCGLMKCWPTHHGWGKTTLMVPNPHGINTHCSKPSCNQPSWFETLEESALMETLMNRTLMDWNPHGKTTLMVPNPHGSTLMVQNPHGNHDGNPHEPNPHGSKSSWNQPSWLQTLMESTLIVSNPHGNPHGNTHEPYPHGLKSSWIQPSWFQTLMESTLMV